MKIAILLGLVPPHPDPKIKDLGFQLLKILLEAIIRAAGHAWGECYGCCIVKLWKGGLMREE